MNYVKKVISIALLATVGAPTGASAYGPEGPFQNATDVRNAWAEFAPAWAAYVYLDNQLIYNRRGFGPAANGAYVSCGNGLIYQNSCPTTQANVLCLCEHLGSQWDGICEAYTFPNPLSGNETFSWTPFGQAWIPYYQPPQTPFAIYNVNPYGTGGLNVTVTFPNGSSQSTQCAFGT